jgi:hypothetical protein
MLIQGGTGADGTLTDTWALSLGTTPTWNAVQTVGLPPHRWGAGAVYDPPRDRMLVVGGYDDTDLSNDPSLRVWSLSLQHQLWRRLPIGGVAGEARFRYSLVYEPEQDLLVAFGGHETKIHGTFKNDTKRLDCAGGWWLETGATANGDVQVDPDRACFAPNQAIHLIASPTGGAALNQWIGDASGNSNPLSITMDGNKTILAEILERATAVENLPIAFALSIHPNPSRGPIRIEYALPRETQMKLRVFDIGGREVVRLVDGLQPAGKHVAIWSGVSGGKDLPSGIYLVRCETPARTWTKRIAVLR